MISLASSSPVVLQETKLPISINEIIELYYPAALAAYSPSPTLLVDGFTIVAPITVDIERAKNIPAAHLPLLRSMLKLGLVFGFVAKKPGATLIAFRGTETAEEWLCDFDIALDPCGGAGTGYVHAGFDSIYNCLTIPDMTPTGEEIYVTGHSLGAALALIEATISCSTNSTTKVCTFAGPRIGTAAWAQYYNKTVPDTVRVVNCWDIVPHVPLPPLYQHVGYELVVDGGFALEKRAHSLALSYWPGLRKIVG